MAIQNPPEDEFTAQGVAAIVVTYHPDLSRLRRVIQGLPSGVRIIVVDNNSSDEDATRLKGLLENRLSWNFIRNSTNVGLAAGINIGARVAADVRANFVLLLDQDSVPLPGSLRELILGLKQLESSGVSVGCVGPRLVDSGTGLQHGFHSIRGMRWVRTFPDNNETRPIQCANLNGSGTLMRIQTFRDLGGLDESLFIDHVDTEWAFRLTHSGKHLFGIPGATFEHAMGDASHRFWFFGWRLWPMRSPARHYFLFRNAIRLMRRSYVPTVWKVWAVGKLAVTCLVHGIFDRRRSAQLSQMFRGMRDGIRSSV